MTEGNEYLRVNRERDPGLPQVATPPVPPVRKGWFRFLSPREQAGLLALLLGLLLGCIHLYFLNLSSSPYDLRVLGQAELLTGTDASLRVILQNRTTETGVEGATVHVRLKGKNPGQTASLAQFQTDKHGTAAPRLSLPSWEDGDYVMRISAHWPGGRDEVQHPVKLHRSWQVSLNTDRPIYQPGQVILIRCLALQRPNLKPVGGATAVFTVLDAKGNKIFRHSATTSKFGIASSECPLAEEITEGTYQVECQVGEHTSRIPVEVKTFVLPKFKVEIALAQSFYQPNDSIQGRVHAHYFHGKSVAGAEVAIDVRMQGDSDQAARQLKVRTDDQGIAEFRCPLPESASDRTREKDAEVSIAAQVTDAAGQRQTATVSRLASSQPFRIEVIPEAGNLVMGVANTVYLLASCPDGRPARVRARLTGCVTEAVETDDLGVATFEVNPSAPDVWVGRPDNPHQRDVLQHPQHLNVRAIDAEGRTVSRDVVLACPLEDDFLLRTDKAVYDGNATMHLTVLGKDNGVVFVDFLKDRQTLWTQRVELTGGWGESAFELPPDLFGALSLCSYRAGPGQRPASKTRVVYVRQSRQIDIHTEADQKEYRPGKTARVSFQLRDAEGKAAPGALSLAAVDEAVFSVPGQAPVLESPLFAEEAKLLQPVQALAPWSPNARAAGQPDQRTRLEQALFARTAAPKDKGDRAALMKELLPFLEGNSRVFAVLDNPDWENLMDLSWLSPEALSILRQNGDHSLNCSTYPENARKTKAWKRQALKAIEGAWWAYFGILVVVLVVYVVHFLSRADALGCSFLGVLILFLIGLLLPSVQMVREASLRTQMMNDLKQITIAMESLRAVDPNALARKPPGDEPRLRHWFPETVLWRPEVITDNEGRAEIEMPLADSITTWRLTAHAVTADGHIGSAQSGIRVFQPFFVDLNMPVALTLGDEVTVPAVLSNYLDKPQTVHLKLSDAPWFELKDQADRKVELGVGEVRSVGFRLRARKVGQYRLKVTAQGGGVGDAVERAVEVVPGGQRMEQVVNGNLQRPASIDLVVPEDAIEGSVKGLVRIYPSSFSQVVEGLDQIFQLPHGCFEQTSSTTYPNVLALDYLQRMKQTAPAVETKARNYIRLGYQRLLTFEVAGGGFDWFGRPPASLTLTAYGLMEFEDMARVHEVDPALIQRTRRWLLDQRKADGSWDPGPGHHNFGPGSRLGTTAYIAWAVFANGQESQQASRTRDFLLAGARDVHDPYTLALICNALLAVKPSDPAAIPFLDRLDGAEAFVRGGRAGLVGTGSERTHHVLRCRPRRQR